jgi:hypothetical protein
VTFERLHDTTVRIRRLSERTLAECARRYGLTVDELFAANPDPPLPRPIRTVSDVEVSDGREPIALRGRDAFARRVEAGASFALPVPASERALLWERTPWPRGQALSALCGAINQRRAQQHLPPVQPAELWAFAVNAPVREAALGRVEEAQRADRDAHPDTIVWEGDAPATLHVPGDPGQPQVPARALPNGSVTTEVSPAWLVRARRDLEMLEVRLDALSHASAAIERAEGLALQETTLITLLERYIELLEQNQGVTGRYAEERRRVGLLRDAAIEHVVHGELRVSRPHLLAAQDASARWVEMLAHRNAGLRTALEEVTRAASPPAEGQPAHPHAAAARAVLEWSRRLFGRSIEELARVRRQVVLLDQLHQASGNLADLARHGDSPMLWALGGVASLTPMFVGNAPGPANLYLAAIQYAVYRDLTEMHLVAWQQMLPGGYVRQKAGDIARVFGATASAEANLVEAVMAGERRGIERAARDITSEVQAGRPWALLLLVCAGLSLYATHESWRAGDTTKIEAILGAGSSALGSVSALSQIVLKTCTSPSQLAGFVGEHAGRMATVLGAVASAYSLYNYLQTTPRDKWNYWKIGGYTASTLGGLLTLATYLWTVPGGQLVGGVLSFGGVLLLLLAEEETARQFAEGPINTFVRHVVERIESGEHYQRALQRGAPSLVTAMSNVRYAIATYNFVVGQLFYVRNHTERAQILAELARLGIPEERGQLMIRIHTP